MQLAIVAAGFTPGEADQLRRAMAAWKRKGGLGHFEERLIERHARARLCARNSRERIFQQILGFGEYGFPGVACRELRAAGLRLGLAQAPRAGGVLLRRCSTASRWASTRRRSWCRTRAATASRCGRWMCARATGIARSNRAPTAASGPALRLGLRLVKGFAQDAGQRLVEARARRQDDADWASPQELAEQARLDRRAMGCLAAAGALAAAWRPPPPRRVAGGRPGRRRCPCCRRCASPRASRCCGRRARARTSSPTTPTPGLTLRRHPLALLREPLAARGYVDSARLRELPDGRRPCARRASSSRASARAAPRASRS